MHMVTRLWAGQLKRQGLIPGRARDFSFLHNVQTSTGVHTAYYAIGTRGDTHFHSPIYLHCIVINSLSPRITCLLPYVTYRKEKFNIS